MLTHTRALAALLAGIIGGLSTAPAEAQVISRPTRAFRGLFGGSQTIDPNRTRQELTFSLNALGGYDDNAQEGAGDGPPAAPVGPGYTGVFDASLRYFRGRATRQFRLDVGGSHTTYRDVPLPGSTSGIVTVNGQTDWGRRSTIAGTASLGYFSQLALDGPLAAVSDPDFSPSAPSLRGVQDRRSIQAGGSATLTRQFTNRLRSTAVYAYTNTSYEDEVGGQESHRIEATFFRRVGRWSSLLGSYEYGNTQFGLGPSDPGRPLLEHRVSGGFDVQRRLSPSRSWTTSLQAGGLRIESATVPSLVRYTLWTPFVQATTQVDTWRNWNFVGTYRRGAQALSGIDSAEAFVTDSASASLGGLVNSRVDLVFSGGFSIGSVGEGVESQSDYTTASGSVQVRVAVTRMLALVTSYHHYRYRFDDTLLPPGLPSNYQRNALRVGLSLWLPLYGAYADAPGGR
jgi:hypothetical protein